MVAGCALLTLGIIELFGGICAIKRRHWLFALIAAILGMTIPAIMGLALVWDEFKLTTGTLF